MGYLIAIQQNIDINTSSKYTLYSPFFSLSCTFWLERLSHKSTAHAAIMVSQQSCLIKVGGFNQKSYNKTYNDSI